MSSSVSDKFRGLPMGDLIGGPLQAACQAQTNLAQATANFINSVGLDHESGEVKMVNFTFERPKAELTETNGAVKMEKEKVQLTVPFLSLVNTPALAIKRVNITFDMEVKETVSEKSSKDTKFSSSAGAKGGFLFFASTHVNISGSVSTHKENTRNTDCSAKYHVEVFAEDSGMPEGMSRVYDILHSAIAPVSIVDSDKALPKGTTPEGATPADETPVEENPA